MIRNDIRDAYLLPVITLWQPWASWIMLGWKTIETRTHTRFYCLTGKTIAIHAAKHWDKDAKRIAMPYLSEKQIVEHVEKANYMSIQGCILGTAVVKEFRKCFHDDAPKALIECDTTRYGLILTDVHRIDPLYIKGRQGIWYVPQVTIAQKEKL